MIEILERFLVGGLAFLVCILIFVGFTHLAESLRKKTAQVIAFLLITALIYAIGGTIMVLAKA